MNLKLKNIFIALAMGILPSIAHAQDAAPQLPSDKSWLQMPMEQLLPIVLIVFILGVVALALTGLILQFGIVYRRVLIKEGVTDLPWIFKFFGIFDGDVTAVTGNYADQVIEGHEYDGIQEFDNDLPPWWIAMFYLTIVFAVVYIGHYHIFKTGDMQEAEYNTEIADANARYADVDQDYEMPSTDAAGLEAAKTIFMENCLACHGEKGQGNIGPNLTDKFWLYKGGINDVYKTVKYGAQRGMKSWKNEFSNQQIYEISSYVLSLQGTNPEGGLPPEGEEYIAPAKAE